MSSASVRARLPLRMFTAASGIGLFAYLAWRAGPYKLFTDIVALRWGFVLIIVLAGCSHLVKTFAWGLMLRAGKQKLPFSRLFGLRLGAEAMGQLGFVGQTFGDFMRISFLGPEVPVARGVTSVSLDRGIFFVTGTAVTILGIGDRGYNGATSNCVTSVRLDFRRCSLALFVSAFLLIPHQTVFRFVVQIDRLQ